MWQSNRRGISLWKQMDAKHHRRGAVYPPFKEQPLADNRPNGCNNNRLNKKHGTKRGTQEERSWQDRKITSSDKCILPLPLPLPASIKAAPRSLPPLTAWRARVWCPGLRVRARHHTARTDGRALTVATAPRCRIDSQSVWKKETHQYKLFSYCLRVGLCVMRSHDGVSSVSIGQQKHPSE